MQERRMNVSEAQVRFTTSSPMIEMLGIMDTGIDDVVYLHGSLTAEPDGLEFSGGVRYSCSSVELVEALQERLGAVTVKSFEVVRRRPGPPGPVGPMGPMGR